MVQKAQQEVEDFLHGKSDLLSDIFDLEKLNEVNAYKLRLLLDKNLSEFRVDTGEENIQTLRFFDQFLKLHVSHIQNAIQCNSLEYKRAEFSTCDTLRKMLTNKDTVLNFIFKINKIKDLRYMGKATEFGKKIRLEDGDYRKYILDFQNSYIAIYKHTLNLTRQEVFVDPISVKARILGQLERLTKE